MKTSTSQKIKIGIFTLVGILLLIGGVFTVGKKKNMFTDTFTIYGLYKNVGGLQIGNNVRFSGITIGSIQDITILSDTVIRVDMILQTKVRHYIKTSTIASIGSDGLMGDKLVTIVPGAANGTELPNGARIGTVNPVEYDKMMAKATTILDHASVITDGLADIITQIQSGRGSIGRLVYSDDLSKSISNTVNAAHKTMVTIDSGAKGFSENMKGIQHNVLLKGYFKKKAQKEQKKKDAMQQQEAPVPEKTK